MAYVLKEGKSLDKLDRIVWNKNIKKEDQEGESNEENRQFW